MININHFITGYRQGERRLIFRNAETRDDSVEVPPAVPAPEATAETTPEKESGLTDYASKIEDGDRAAIKERIATFLEDDGAVLGQEIAEINALIKDALFKMKALEGKSISEFNELTAGLPSTNDTLVSFAMRVGLLTVPEFQSITWRAGQKNTMRTPGAPAPGYPSDPYNMPRNAAYVPSYGQEQEGGPEISKEEMEARLLAELQVAKQDISALNTQRSRMLRQRRADRRSYSMNPSQRLQQYGQLGDQIRGMREGMGNPTARYWQIRKQWEALSGMSYSRYLGQKKGITMLPAPSAEEHAVNFKIVDAATGKSLGYYNQWTGSYAGKMPREQAISIIGSSPNLAVSGKEARIVVDGSMYLAPRSYAPAEGELIRYNVSPLEQQTRRFLTPRGPYSEPYSSWERPRGDEAYASAARDDVYRHALISTGSRTAYLEHPHIAFAPSTPSSLMMGNMNGMPSLESVYRSNPIIGKMYARTLRRMEEADRAADSAISRVTSLDSRLDNLPVDEVAVITEGNLNHSDMESTKDKAYTNFMGYLKVHPAVLESKGESVDRKQIEKNFGTKFKITPEQSRLFFDVTKDIALFMSNHPDKIDQSKQMIDDLFNKEDGSFAQIRNAIVATLVEEQLVKYPLFKNYNKGNIREAALKLMEDAPQSPTVDVKPVPASVAPTPVETSSAVSAPVVEASLPAKEPGGLASAEKAADQLGDIKDEFTDQDPSGNAAAKPAQDTLSEDAASEALDRIAEEFTEE